MKRIFSALLVCAFLLGGVFSASLPAAIFSDTAGHPLATAIDEISNQGVMLGLGNGSFAPDQALTRGQAAALLNKLFTLDYGDRQFFKQPEVTDYYDDISPGAWLAGAATLSAINGIFDTVDRQFAPQRPITRAELALAVQRCFTAKKINVITIQLWPVFQDVEGLSPEQLQAVVFASNTGILKGEDGKFRPADPVTRAEAAQVALNVLNVIKTAASNP